MNFRKDTVTLAVVLALLGLSANAIDWQNLKIPGFQQTKVNKFSGRPVTQQTPELPDECYKFRLSEIEADKNHPCHPKIILQKANYPGGQVQTDAPVIGILVQPYLNKDDSGDSHDNIDDFQGTYIPSAHVKFLEAAGARIMPVNYRMDKNEFGKLLKQLNGIYIPGDSEKVLSNKKYMACVAQILTFAQDLNAKSINHFPVLAISYGYLALIQALSKGDSKIEDMPEEYVQKSVQVNLKYDVQDTFLYDGRTHKETEDMLDQIYFFNELDVNIKLENFFTSSYNQVRKILAPIVTYDDNRNNQNREFIAVVEGVILPIWGIAFSIEKVIYSIDFVLLDKVDHSQYAVHEAHRIANFFVDEAKLSGSTFTNRKKEQKMLIQNFQANLAQRDMIQENGDNHVVLMYLFE